MTKTEQLRVEREQRKQEKLVKERERLEGMRCLLYTSDAADDV